MTKLMQAGRALIALCRVLIASLVLGGLSGTALAGELVTYYHNDVAGSPIAATDAKGYYIWRTSYEPYGQRIQNDIEYAASIENNRWFTGHVEDVETGTIYMQARHYDPAIGRFMSVDPIRFMESEPHTFTRYAYAANNPYRYTDPDGEFINFIVGGVKAAVENIAIQHIEMALGTRDSFSWGELAFDTTLGAATSGLSTIKNAARVANMASDVVKMEHAGDAARALKIVDGASDSARGAGSALREASSAAFRAADDVAAFRVPVKHLPGAGGRYAKFGEGVDPQGAIAEALRSPNAVFSPNNVDESFRVVTDLGRAVGSRGETALRVVVGNDGKIWTAFPVKP
ncbi:RHS repeat domain-containing protein [Steroidobacter cummioxidans]|uniref:RHS repeat domain-containing protein n=1 Tax=Steroidobacter cummioxidans TaxID=1803913 RepID=UPI00137AFC0D|nr:RHS repeat-associated core domain-containing protein [Steroidobacter cummioxidans]